MTQMLHVPSCGGALATSIDLPGVRPGEPGQPAAPCPVVIAVHGLTGNRIGRSYNLVHLARRLAARGIACIRFDQRGCGESTGEFVEYTLESARDDVLSVIDWAREQPWCNGEVGLVGVSLGAMPVVAADAARQAAGIALWGGVHTLSRLVDQLHSPEAQALFDQQGWVPFKGLPLGLGFVAAAGSIDVDAALAEAQAPLLVAHSRSDNTVPYTEAEAYAAQCQTLGRACKLLTLDEVDHDFTEFAGREPLLQATVAFFAKALLSG